MVKKVRNNFTSLQGLYLRLTYQKFTQIYFKGQYHVTEFVNLKTGAFNRIKNLNIFINA